jgi:hypothetical protein
MKSNSNNYPRNLSANLWYKTSIAACASFLLAISAQAELPATLTTTDGQTYNDVSIVRVEPDGYLINYKPQENAVGMAKIKFTRLSADLQKQAGYDPDKSKKYESEVAKANEDLRQEIARLEQVAKTDRQARQAEDAQHEQLAIQRINALAELKMAEANLAAKGGADNSGYGGYYGGAVAYAIPEVDFGNRSDFRTYYTSPLNRVPNTEIRPAYTSGKPILAPFTPRR